MKKIVTVLFLFISLFAYGQTHNPYYEQAMKDSIAAAEMAKEMEAAMQQMYEQEQKHPKSKEQNIKDSIAAAEEAAQMLKAMDSIMTELTNANKEALKIFQDTAYIDSLKKANKDFSFVGTWRGKIDKEEITLMFFQDSTWRGKSSKNGSGDIAGRWTYTADSLLMVGSENKKYTDPHYKSKEEKIYVKYLAQNKKEVWLYFPYIKEKCVFKKVQ